MCIKQTNFHWNQIQELICRRKYENKRVWHLRCESYAPRKYCINNKNPQPTSANKQKRQTANKRHEKWPRIGANAKRYFCIFRHALCSCQFLPAALPLPPSCTDINRSTQCLLCESKNYLQQTSDLNKKPEKENQFCENYWLSAAALVLVFV